MTDKKISALTAATTPLAGTEVLPIVQSGATVKVAVSDLTANRAITATSINKVAITTPATSATLTIADGKTLTANNSLTFAGTDATTMTFPATSASIARIDAAQSFIGDQTLSTGNLIVSNGKGIDFSATSGTGTSELFNDYEEGTWTPTDIGGVLVVVGTFSSSGTYTKIGKVVTVSGTLNGTTSVAITGGANVVCGGLPYSAAANTLCPGNAVNAAATATASLYANSGTNVGSVTAMAATTSIFFSITYFV